MEPEEITPEEQRLAEALAQDLAGERTEAASLDDELATVALLQCSQADELTPARAAAIWDQVLRTTKPAVGSSWAERLRRWWIPVSGLAVAGSAAALLLVALAVRDAQVRPTPLPRPAGQLLRTYLIEPSGDRAGERDALLRAYREEVLDALAHRYGAEP